MPILGIFASAISGNLVTNSYESIQTVTLTSTQATVDFTSIPSTFKHLQIRYIARNSAANTDGYQAIQFNNDSTNGNYYFYHFLEGVGSNPVVSAAGGTNAGILAGRNSGASATSGVFGAGIIDILDYTNTNKNKVVRVLAGSDNNGSGNVLDLSSGFWLNTAAVTSIKLLAGLGGYSFVSGTTFALYGIKG